MQEVHMLRFAERPPQELCHPLWFVQNAPLEMLSAQAQKAARWIRCRLIQGSFGVRDIEKTDRYLRTHAAEFGDLTEMFGLGLIVWLESVTIDDDRDYKTVQENIEWLVAMFSIPLGFIREWLKWRVETRDYPELTYCPVCRNRLVRPMDPVAVDYLMVRTGQFAKNALG